MVEATSPDREAVARAMGLPSENFLPDRHPFSATEQMLNYQRLLLHILAEALPPQEASADLGRRTLEESAEIIVQEVHHRPEHPEEYRRHGGCLREGLWRATR